MITINIARKGRVYGFRKAYTITVKGGNARSGYLAMDGLTFPAMRRQLGAILRRCIVAQIPYEITGEYVKKGNVGRLK